MNPRMLTRIIHDPNDLFNAMFLLDFALDLIEKEKVESELIKLEKALIWLISK